MPATDTLPNDLSSECRFVSGRGKIRGKAERIFNESAREWFSRRIVDHTIETLPTRDRDDYEKIKTQASSTINAVADFVQSKILAKNRQEKNSKRLAKFEGDKRLVQTIYSVIGMNPELFADRYRSFLNFIIDRRFRMVEKMLGYVNPNDKWRMFRYPRRKEDWSLNDTVKQQKLWESFTYAGRHLDDERKHYAFKLHTPEGKSDPVGAVEKLFIPHGANSRNRLDCAFVACIVHLDSLLSSRNPDKFMKALVQEGSKDTGDQYILILNPTAVLISTAEEDIEPGYEQLIKVSRPQSFSEGEKYRIGDNYNHGIITIRAIAPAELAQKKIRVASVSKAFKQGSKITVLDASEYVKPPFGIPPKYHFLTDSREDRALFEYKTIKSDDLQIGDHIYIRNHPLYTHAVPFSIWQGLHSFVTERWNRGGFLSAGESIEVSGHGPRCSMPVTAILHKYMLKNIKDFLDFITVEVKRIYGLIEQGKRGYDSDFDFVKKYDPYRSYVSNDLGIKVTYRGKMVEVFFDQSDKQKWHDVGLTRLKDYHFAYIPYVDHYGDYNPDFGLLRSFYIYLLERSEETGKFTIKQRTIGFKDLAKMSLFKDGGIHIDDVYVIRPRVALTDDYLQFLRDNGATG